MLVARMARLRRAAPRRPRPYALKAPASPRSRPSSRPSARAPTSRWSRCCSTAAQCRYTANAQAKAGDLRAVRGEDPRARARRQHQGARRRRDLG
ncbi:MAG: hypothetical protein MZV49_25155 [Rhodopseudomonas palustris]|nr:hypothetical protein [Rhodopseudomonas palustris]